MLFTDTLLTNSKLKKLALDLFFFFFKFVRNLKKNRLVDSISVEFNSILLKNYSTIFVAIHNYENG